MSIGARFRRRPARDRLAPWQLRRAVRLSRWRLGQHWRYAQRLRGGEEPAD